MRSSSSPDMGSAMARPAGPTGMVMMAWVAEFVIALSSWGDASVLHHKTAKDMRKNRTLVDQNMLLRITFKYYKYALENHNQERKSADENQFRLCAKVSHCCQPVAPVVSVA